MDCVRTAENSGTALIVTVISWTQNFVFQMFPNVPGTYHLIAQRLY